MKHFVVGVDWYGPYLALGETSVRAVAAADAAEFNPCGLYCAIGPRPDGSGSGPLYVGLSTGLSKRLRQHKGLEWVEREAGIEQMWLGYPATADQSGRRARIRPRTIDDAEWCHIFFMQPPFNTQRAGTPPAQNVTVLNRWWHVDGRPRMRRPHSSWPDLFDYMGQDRRSRAVWFGGRVESYDLHDKDLTAVVGS